MKWISVNTRKPILGQKCYCYYVMETHAGTIVKGTRLLYYLKLLRDKRKSIFCDKDNTWYDMGFGTSDWPVTHWMPEPNPPTSTHTL